jgi:hypothetical protein
LEPTWRLNTKKQTSETVKNIKDWIDQGNREDICRDRSMDGPKSGPTPRKVIVISVGCLTTLSVAISQRPRLRFNSYTLKMEGVYLSETSIRLLPDYAVLHRM